ncbi:MAG: hypothetical protein GMKNLPBB_00715 [Myxococcota bacterium]|nr:hypothetical protein [Myxococcota bacterium]
MIAGLLALPPAEGRAANFGYRLVLNVWPEADTNATRVTNNANPPPVAGGLINASLFADGAWLAANRQHLVDLSWSIGGKVFFSERTEDMLVNAADARYSFRPIPMLAFGVQGRLKDMRLRLSDRDFTSLSGMGTADIQTWPMGSIQGRGGVRGFAFHPDPTFSFVAPSVGGSLRQGIVGKLAAAAGYDLFLKNFSSAAFVRVADPTGKVAVAQGEASRSDNLHALSFNLSWTGSFIAEGGYLLQINNSNSVGESITRHRVTAGVTFVPFWEIFAQLQGQLQFTRFGDGIFLSQTLFLENDDENQSAVMAAIGREIGSGFTLQGQYKLFASEFSRNGAVFTRHVITFGITWRFEGVL